MSKFSKYLEASKIEVHQTVQELAADLNKSADQLLEQFSEAGIPKSSPLEMVSSADKQKLLEWLKKEHSTQDRPRKRITLSIDSLPERLWQAVAKDTNGAEWETLGHFTSNILLGIEIQPRLQRLVNLIIAQSFICEALPLKRRGRPQDEKTQSQGRDISYRYWEMRDAGVSYSEAVGLLAASVHKDERHIMRLVEKHKKSIGLTFEERESRRNFYNLYASLGSSVLPSLSEDEDPQEFTLDDFLDHLRELVENEVGQKKPPLT